jgi:hypothetical protein
MLGHAANIAWAIRHKEHVMIPDVFVLDGSQVVHDEAAWKDTLPTPENSVSLGKVFDTVGLISEIRSYGGEATLVPYMEKIQGKLMCSFTSTLKSSDPFVVTKILSSMRPSAGATSLLDGMRAAIVSYFNNKEGLFVDAPDIFGGDSPSHTGVCLHHREGEDWETHCAKWEALSKEHRNCMSKKPLSQGVLRRISHLRAPWIFYAGDRAIPREVAALGLPVVSRELAFPSASEVVAAFTDRQIKSVPRDLGALLDYFLCFSMSVFIGNSASTWSAAHIAQRSGMASWYNSQFIPLADAWQTFYIPVVYTYTEGSSVSGKYLLQVSILSVKRFMPRAGIHVLYHGVGAGDIEFRRWLLDHDVRIYEHHPQWKSEVERLRVAGDAQASHLYSNQGNYLGTWQRIDIPLHLSVEYCLLLDSDTVVTREFTMASFGKNLTIGMAQSSELNEDDGMPSNAGVTLMNVPFLRESVRQFQEFIFRHETPDFSMGPSDQGAYLEYYGSSIRFLSTRFNMKPYYYNTTNWNERYIVHFHGLKPNDFMEFWLAGTCEPLKCYLLFRFEGSPFQCAGMQDWAKAAMHEGPQVVEKYCNHTLPKYGKLCSDVFNSLARKKSPMGVSCKTLIQDVIIESGLDVLSFPYLY